MTGSITDVCRTGPTSSMLGEGMRTAATRLAREAVVRTFADVKTGVLHDVLFRVGTGWVRLPDRPAQRVAELNP